MQSQIQPAQRASYSSRPANSSDMFLAYQRVMKVDESTADDPHDPSSGKADFYGDFTKRCIRSEDLFKGDREVVILHNQEPYRLLVTKNNKLILQK